MGVWMACRCLKKFYMGEELIVPEKEGSWELVCFQRHWDVPLTWNWPEMMYRTYSQFSLVYGYLSCLLLSYFSFLYLSLRQLQPYSFFLLCFIILQLGVSNHDGGKLHFCLNSWSKIANITQYKDWNSEETKNHKCRKWKKRCCFGAGYVLG